MGTTECRESGFQVSRSPVCLSVWLIQVNGPKVKYPHPQLGICTVAFLNLWTTNTALCLSGTNKLYLLKVVADLPNNTFPYHYILNEALTKVISCFENDQSEDSNIFEGFWVVVLFHYLVLLLLPQSQSSKGFVLLSSGH